jgi:CDP-diacylglycerol--glycerol-3-phosphate 3-phosphatidyltransferase
MNFSTTRTHLRRLFSRTVEGPSVAVLHRLGVTPNQLTLAGLAIAGVAAWLLATGHFVIAALVLLFSGFFDLLDGALARRTGQSTPFGAVLDSVADRVGEAGLFLGLLVWAQQRGDATALILSYVAVVTSFLVSYARSRAEGIGIQGAVGFAGRAERIVILAIGLLLGYPSIALAVISALAAVTFVQRVLHVWWTAGRKKTTA